MSVFDWRGPSSVFAGEPEHAARQLEGMSPQAAFYWRKKAGLTGTRDKPVRGWREDSCYFVQAGDRDREALS